MLFARSLDRDLITGIRMAHHAARWIVPQHAFEFLPRLLAAIGHDHDARMLRITHADAAAVVK